MKPWRWWHLLAIDLRSLALFRVAVSCCLLFDLITRIPEINDFYTDAGILPRDALVALGNPWMVTLHMLSGQYIVQLAMFVIAIGFALGLLVGYRTRLCAVVSWLLVCSLQARNPAILHGGDDLIRLLLFWSMFVPLNARFSLDRALNPAAPVGDDSYFSEGSLGLVLQICFMYWFTAVHKWHPIWNSEGSAVYYALSLAQFATPFGTKLLAFPSLLRLITFGTLAFEFIAPMLAFCPAFNGAVRLAMVPIFMSFHAGLGFTMRLGNFPWVCAAAWLVFLPPLFWQILERRLPTSADRGTIIFVDGACAFCRQVSLILRGLLGLRNTEIREAQNDPQADALMRARNAWVVRDAGGTLHTGYEAFVELCRRSVVMSTLIGLIGSPFARRVGDSAYRWVATHRTEAGRLLRSLTPPPPPQYLGPVASTLAIASIVFILYWNLAGLSTQRPPIFWRQIGALTQLQQQWKLFAPYPLRDGGWYVMEGVKLDGTHFDLWRGGGPATDERPKDPSAAYVNAQWRKYLGNIWERDYAAHRMYFGRYLCRRWNERHTDTDRVNTLYISFMLEVTPPPGTPRPPVVKQLVWRHYCFDKPADW